MDQIIFKFFGFLIILDRILLAILVISSLLLFTRYAKKAKKILTFSVLCFLGLASVPIGEVIVNHLENRFKPVAELDPNIKGFILLGGSIDFSCTSTREQPCFNLAGGRILDFVSLALKYPELPIVFTGGGRTKDPRSNEASNALKTLVSLGIKAERIILENESKTTIENATYAYNLIKPKSTDQWALVTSAFHLPRSVGLFQGAGWNVLPIPVDYHSPKEVSIFNLHWDLYKGILFWSIGIRELGGLSTNYIAGRSSEWIPGE